MAESGVTITTICHEAAVDSFRFSRPSYGYCSFILLVVVERTILYICFALSC